MSNSMEDFKLNEYQNFHLIPANVFSFYELSVNRIIFIVSHRLLFCALIEVDLKKKKKEIARDIHISPKVKPEHKTQPGAITHANTSNRAVNF